MKIVDKIDGIVEKYWESNSAVWSILREVLVEDFVIHGEDGVYVTNINKYDEMEEIECFRFSLEGSSIFAAEEALEEDIEGWIELNSVSEAIQILTRYDYESRKKDEALKKTLSERCG